MGSMAQPKSRVKYSIDPNALNWVNNEDKFGKRLMEKMGWTSGKGLGANEDGRVESIKVKLKSDNKGVGYNNHDYDNVWLDHQDDFEAVLNNLNKENGKQQVKEEIDSTINSLENKSKNRGRLHYSKFAKSKDLSLRSSTDIDLILGRHKRKKSTKEPNSEDNEDEVKNKHKIEREDSDGDKRPSFQLNSEQINGQEKSTADKTSKKEESNQFSTNTLSISDYFAKKMNKNKKVEEVVERNEEVELEVTTSKAKKKKEKKEKHSSESKEAAPQNETLQNDSELASKPKKHKKSKKRKHENEEPESVETLKEIHLNVKCDTSVTETIEREQNDKPLSGDDAFKGSNLSGIYGYTPYNINCSLESILDDKYKKANKKRSEVSKNLKIDAKFYENRKKKLCS